MGSGLDTPPVPIAATYALASNTWTCTFNRPLQPGVLNAGNWFMRASGTTFGATSATAAGAVVAGSAGGGILDPGPDVIAYAPPPADVLSLTGLPAAAFTDFPLVVT